MLNKKILLSVAGSVTAVASTIVLVDFINRKALKKNTCGYELAVGILGLAAGTALTVLVQTRLSDALAPMADEGSESETPSAEASSEPNSRRNSGIELDEDASIEDFL